MGAKVTIKDVAELAGVSKSTVSRYLNHGYISLEKQQRVREAIEKTGFKSNFFAKRLKTQESKLIGIVLPRIDSVTVGKLLSGINRIFDPAGYQGILLVSHLSIEKELENIQDSVGLTDRHIEIAKSTPVPIVYTGQWNEAVPSIKIDDWAAGRMVGAYLRQMGHRHAVFAGVTPTDKAVGIERKQGFIEAFCEDRPEARVDFIETGFDFLSAYNKGAAILEMAPTVVVGATDNISLGVLRYLHERGIRVPEQISVVGFGGYDVGAVVYPALTTVAFDYELLGMKAAQYLLDLLAHRDVEENMTLPLFFVERESVRNLTAKYETKAPASYLELT